MKWSKESLFKKWCWEKRVSLLLKMDSTRYFTPYPKLIQDLDIRHESLRYTEENTERTFHDIENRRIFNEKMEEKDKAKGSKDKQNGHHQIKRLLHHR